MRAVMLSIQPKWCELIASGKKTIEVRKSRPKIETPFKVYIYCTKSKQKELLYEKTDGAISENGKHYSLFASSKVIGEFMCDKIDTYPYYLDYLNKDECMYYITTEEGEKTCLEYDEFVKYGDGKTLHAWHILDLKIYDKPKEIREFYSICKNYKSKNFDKCINGLCKYNYCVDAHHECSLKGLISLTRPPQSWCYIEEVSK